MRLCLLLSAREAQCALSRCLSRVVTVGEIREHVESSQTGILFVQYLTIEFRVRISRLGRRASGEKGRSVCASEGRDGRGRTLGQSGKSPELGHVCVTSTRCADVVEHARSRRFRKLVRQAAVELTPLVSAHA